MGKREVEDGGHKSRVEVDNTISQLPDKVATELQRLTNVFGIQQKQRWDTVEC